MGNPWAVLATALFLAAPAAADSRITFAGTVSSVDETELVLRDADGRPVAVRLAPSTRYVQGRDRATQGDLAKGVHVQVEADEIEGRRTARLVRIGAFGRMPTGKAAARRGADAADDQGSHASHDHGSGRGPRRPARWIGRQDPHAGHAQRRRKTFGPRDEPRLFQSDMTVMAGMRPHDPAGAMPMPDWHWMTSGIVRGQYNRQGGPRGDSAVESTNWSMVMGQRDVAGGRLTLMLMNSLEPATLPSGGTPQLFQAGETFDGRPLVDRQHPHDFFMNLSATYRRAFRGHGAWWVQLSPRGEPALGPTTYMHRASAGDNPAAILSHHFQDSTHIADSVVTAGLGWRRVSVEGSAFHGEEPDEGRWDLDPGALDSVSGRLKLWLSDRWSAQVSYGFLESPEALEEGDVRRTTVSLHYGELGHGPVAASLVWGRNREEHGTFDGFVLEGAWQPTRRDQLYARAEAVDRDLHLLETRGLDEPHHAGGDGDEEVVTVGAFTAGYVRDLKRVDAVPVVRTLFLGLGADVTLYGIPSRLEPAYGETRASFHVFGRLRWGRPHDGGAAHGEHGAAHH